LIHVVADSTCDLPPDWLERYPITIVPIHILFGTESLREDVDIDRDEFYRRVDATRTIPKTSQPAPADFVSAYRRITARGDTLIPIHPTGTLSATVQSAELAANHPAGEIN